MAWNEKTNRSSWRGLLRYIISARLITFRTVLPACMSHASLVPCVLSPNLLPSSVDTCGLHPTVPVLTLWTSLFVFWSITLSFPSEIMHASYHPHPKHHLPCKSIYLVVASLLFPGHLRWVEYNRVASKRDSWIFEYSSAPGVFFIRPFPLC